VQSVAVRLIVEREREIQNFKSEPYYSVSAVFAVTNTDGSASEVKALLSQKLKSQEEVEAFLEACKETEWRVESVQKKPLKRTPAPPFTTSTLQQEAARKLGFTVSQTMMVAQRLYEGGRITYMRTDSVNLSSLAINTAKEEIKRQYGEEYSKVRQYHTSSKGAQEAHEAIRPTYMDQPSIEGTAQERRLYDLIWKRTAASQMADAEIEKTTVEICATESGPLAGAHKFVATGEVIKFDGFLKAYRESYDDEDDSSDDFTRVLPPLAEGTPLTRREITASERYSQGPQRFTEAMLVHKLEELGIGRPSTYAPTISTIQQREYVVKGDKKGEDRLYDVITLKGKQITSKKRHEMAASEKGKLMPTDIGLVVNDYLMEHFPNIMDYNFTAKVEQDFDKIAEGRMQWTKMMKDFDSDFEPTVDKAINQRAQHKAGERLLGNDPKSGRPVYTKIGRFGPVIQIGTAGDKDKPVFAHMPKELSMETVTLQQALDLFKLPRMLGEYEGEPITVGTGRFGPYVLHKKLYASLPKDANPMTITIGDAVKLINDKRHQEEKKHLRVFTENMDLEILNGRYGPYICYKGKNIRLPKAMHERARDLSYEEVMAVVEKAKS
jgi:DNA topoisomerase-1